MQLAALLTTSFVFVGKYLNLGNAVILITLLRRLRLNVACLCPHDCFGLAVSYSKSLLQQLLQVASFLAAYHTLDQLFIQSVF